LATQGQRRQEAVAAIRKMRAVYRRMDSLGEAVERELDRLVKRKTLIGPDQLNTVMNRLNIFLQMGNTLQSAAVLSTEIIANLPR